MKLLYNLLIASLFIVACSTERIEPENDQGEYESAEEFLESEKPEEQEVEITKDGEGPIIGKNGTKIWLGKDILQYPNGDSVTYPFTIKLIELYTPKDMILSRMPTVSGQQLLTCHGEVRVRAYKDDVELMLRPDALWKLEVPNNTPYADMICYYGNNVDANANWTNEFETLFTPISDGYSGLIERLGWVSCAKPAFSDEPTVQYSFYSDSINISSFSTFLYLPELDGVMQSAATSYNIPLDEELKTVSVASKADTLYTYYKYTIVGDETSIELIPENTSDAEFIQLLNNL